MYKNIKKQSYLSEWKNEISAKFDNDIWDGALINLDNLWKNILILKVFLPLLRLNYLKLEIDWIIFVSNIV